MRQFDPNIPWNDLPELPPAVDIESRDILKACISAMAELSKANALVKTLPNAGVLINTLPLQEARRSSEIENIVTTNDDLYRAMASDRNQLEAVEQTSQDTADKIDAINRLINNVITTARDKTKAVEREGFVDLLFKWPYCKIGIVEQELACSRITATRYLNQMVTLGVLERVKIGREYYYINRDLMELLSE
ncbi:MAG: hypothetical protein OXG97_19715 [Candidatus Poribacteria bacterium]|nr:hypothetical protein [Candidatus Poribacteria bacterium]